MMNNYGELTEAGTVRFERLLPGPVERVWSYLTQPEKRAKWLAGGKMDLKVGGNVELLFNNLALSPHEDEVPDKYRKYEGETRFYGQITRLDPPRLLSFTWEEKSERDSDLVSEVTFELEPKGDKVHMILTHRRIGDDRERLTGILTGWHTHLKVLEDRLQGRTPPAYWTQFTAMENEYKNRTG